MQFKTLSNVHDIGIFCHLHKDLSAFGSLQIQRDRSLVPVNSSEVVRHGTTFRLPCRILSTYLPVASVILRT